MGRRSRTLCDLGSCLLFPPYWLWWRSAADMCATNDIIYVCYFLHVMSDINRETTAPEDPNAAAAVVLPNGESKMLRF